MHIYTSLPLSVGILAALKTSYGLKNGLDREKHSWRALKLGLAFAPLPFGLLLAQFLTSIVFKLEDTYITESKTA